MTLANQDIELIKREVAGIRDFYQARMDAELPPLQEEVGRLAAQLGRAQEQWREGERRAILAKYGGDDRPRVLQGSTGAWTPWPWPTCAACSTPNCGSRPA